MIAPLLCQLVPTQNVKLVGVSIQGGECAINTLVARPVNRKDVRSNPKAQEALDVEWNKLVKKTAWLYDAVSDWKSFLKRPKSQARSFTLVRCLKYVLRKAANSQMDIS